MTAEKRIGLAISAASSGEAVAMIERAEELRRFRRLAHHRRRAARRADNLRRRRR